MTELQPAVRQEPLSELRRKLNAWGLAFIFFAVGAPLAALARSPNQRSRSATRTARPSPSWSLAGLLCMLPPLLATCAAAVLFRRKPGLGNSWKAMVAPTVAVVGIGTVMVPAPANLELLVVSATAGPHLTIAIILVIALSVGLDFWYRAPRPDVHQRIGRQAEELIRRAPLSMTCACLFSRREHALTHGTTRADCRTARPPTSQSCVPRCATVR